MGTEFQLFLFLLVQAVILVTGWRFAGRYDRSLLQRLIDTLLWSYFIQYAVVTLLGAVGLLWPGFMLAAAVLLCAAGEFAARPDKRPVMADGARRGRLITLVALLFVSGYVIGYCWTQRLLPPMATDALTYHFPAAVHWLQQGRIARFQTWFFNPANTYSPLAGSAWYAWLIGPIGADALAIHGQAPMVLLLFLAAVSIGRSLGASHLTAALVAVALCLSRPVVNQLDKGKDDLFLAAFFAVAVAAIVCRRDALSPWRLGLAVGLCLATKYTALLSLPILLLAVRRVAWRDVAVAGGCVLAVAGPWYLVNWVTTGNPLFPTDFLWFEGLFSTARSMELRSIAGVMGVLVGSQFGVPMMLAVVLLVGWLGALPASRGAGRRLVCFGPVVGLTMFLLLSPYPEVRFLLPTLTLLTLSLVLLPGRFAWIVAAIAAMAAVATSISEPALVAEFTAWGVAVAILGTGIVLAQRRLRITLERLALAGAVVALLIAGYAWVNWRAFLRDRHELAPRFWASRGMPGNLWRFVRDELPPGETIAYTGTHLVYPLMDGRPVLHRNARGYAEFHDMPRMGDRLSGEQVDELVKRESTLDPPRGWPEKLLASSADWLVVIGNPPERVVASHRFPMVYSDNYGAVFRLKSPSPPASPAPASSGPRGG